MADNLSTGIVQVHDNSVESINLALLQVLGQVDTIRGLRGSATIYAPTTVDAPEAVTEAVRMEDLAQVPLTAASIWLMAQSARRLSMAEALGTIPDPADAPASADALRDDLVANVLPIIRANLALLLALLERG